MLRRVMMALCLCAFGLCLGCESNNKATNPNNLEYSKEGPPKRDAIKKNK
jgi:hypothetical protein